MTATLMLSTLVGAAASYPLLKWWNELDRDELEKIWRLSSTASWPLLLATLLVPLIVYPWSYAVPLLLVATLTTLFPPLPLVGLFLAHPVLLFFGLLLLGVFIAVLTREHFNLSLPSLSLRRVAILTAVGIILTEGALASANAGLYPKDLPELCAWIGGNRAVPALTSALRSKEVEVHWPAKQELLKIGQPAVPALIGLIDNPDSRVRRDVAAILIKNGQLMRLGEALASALADEDAEVRRVAAEELSRVGDAALPSVIATLKQNYRNPEAVAAAQVAMSGMSMEKLVPALLEAFHSDDKAYRYRVPLNQLKMFGSHAVPQLIEGLAHPDPWVRWLARQALLEIGVPVIDSDHMVTVSSR